MLVRGHVWKFTNEGYNSTGREIRGHKVHETSLQLHAWYNILCTDEQLDEWAFHP